MPLGSPDGVRRLPALFALLCLLAPASPARAAWPGGNGRIAFTGCDNGCEGQVDIFDLGRAGGRVRRLTHSKLRDFAAEYSPDGERIVYVCKGWQRGSHSEICIMNAAGRKRSVLSDDDVEQSSPGWSPDGRHIVFSQTYDDGDDKITEGIYVMRRDGTHVRRIADNGFDPKWSPDGKRIAFVGVPRKFNQEIYLVSPEGKHLKRITHTGTSEDAPSWAPSGHRLTFIRYLDVRGRRAGWQIFTSKRDGTDQQRLTTGGRGLNLSPAWSPDGRWIAFSRNERIYKMRRDGTDLTKVKSGLKKGFEYLNPTWQPLPSD